MFEIIVFVLAYLSDWAVKKWAMDVLAAIPGQSMDIIPGVFWFQYAENPGLEIGIRSRSTLNSIMKIVVLILIIVLLIKYRKQLAPITRFGLMLYAAGMLGNQMNYWTLEFVPDMFMLSVWSGIFNLADVFLVIALLIISIRLIFFEGQTLMQSVVDSFDRKKKRKDNSDNEQEG